ncbi:MAG: alpha/beta hydrolase [Clostridiales bacterium]|nr:alpha/beta hydrolase [Clostridiales bacterium]
MRANHKIKAPGIDQMEMVGIGGIQQSLYFRGQNIENPVILFIHGGPGNSMIQYLHLYQYDWENDFTIVNWDQRNVGKTYTANSPEAVLKTIDVERVLKDAHEVTEYVKQKLNKDKIIIMGHSWGSVLGAMAVQSFPDDYSAYIGVAQVINMADGERVGYEKVLEAAKASGNEKDIKALESIQPYPLTKYDSNSINGLITVRTYQSKYGLSINVGFRDIINILATPYYSFNELKHSGIFNQLKMIRYQGGLLQFLIEEADIKDYGVDYKVPVYYIMGGNDYISPYIVAKEFFDGISAPDKQIYSVPGVGHMPFFENKEEFRRILLEEIRPKVK